MEQIVKKENTSMYILSAFGIIFVLLGHISSPYGHTELFAFCGWFPYYSFHLPLFLFITGYFYKQVSEENIIGFIVKKGKTLLIPFFICNGFFLLLQTYLRKFGFSMGQTFSLYNWLIRPFFFCQPLTFAIPTWYLFSLFFTEILFVLLRKVVKLIIKDHLKIEISLLSFFLLIGMIAIYYINHSEYSEFRIVWCRPFLMLFFIQFGYFYHQYLMNKKQTLKNNIYIYIYYFQFNF